METKKCKHCQTEIPKKAKVCPNCKKKQGGILKTVLIVILIMGIIGSFVPDEEKTEETASTTNQTIEKNNEKTTEIKEENIEYISCNVDEMMDLLSSNALKAEKEYSGKYLEVTGRLAVIDSDGDYIALYPVNDEWAITGIQCYIKNEEQLNHVLDLEIGDTITVKVKCKNVGEVLGYSGDIIEFVN